MGSHRRHRSKPEADPEARWQTMKKIADMAANERVSVVLVKAAARMKPCRKCRSQVEERCLAVR